MARKRTGTLVKDSYRPGEGRVVQVPTGFSFMDRLANFTTNLGTNADKLGGSHFYTRALGQAEIVASYENDWIARKIVDVPAFDMTREGREWQAQKEQIELIEATEARLSIDSKLLEALTLARLDGGSGIVLGLPGAPDTPVGQFGKDALEFVHVMTRYELSARERNLDVASPFFGEPVMYQVHSESKGSYEIHPSRVVRFTGARAPSRRTTDPWGNSVLQSAWDAVIAAATAQSGVAALIPEAKVDVFGIPALTLNMADEDYKKRLLDRFALAAQAKSSSNALILDKEEEYNQKTISFSNLPEVVRVYLEIMAGAADIPATRMLGQSPGGLNSTGDSDIRNYYDRISAEQELVLRPQEFRLFEAIIQSSLGSRPKEIYYRYAPLWQLSEKEKSENFERNAKAYTQLANSRLIPLDALATGVANKIVEDGFLPGFDEALDEATAAPAEYALSEQEEAKIQEKAALAAKNRSQEQFGDAAPRTLYVRRNVLNGAEILKWAKAQGFEQTLEPGDLHVTIAFSRQPLDWMLVESESWGQNEKGEMLVPPGGVRIVEHLGPKGAVVLLFNHTPLAYRHESIKRAGASWDWDSYQPHVSITYNGKGMDLSKIEPYRGKILLGPEIFEEVVDDWEKKIKERAA